MKLRKRIALVMAVVIAGMGMQFSANTVEASWSESMQDDVAGLRWEWTAVLEDGVHYAENVYVTGSNFTGAVLSDDFLKDGDGNAYRIRSIGKNGVTDQDKKDSFIQTEDVQASITIDASTCGYLEKINSFAFRGEGYETIVLPKTVKEILDNAFYGSGEMTVSCENPNIIFGDMSGTIAKTFKWEGPELSTAYEAFSPNGQFTSDGRTAFKCMLDGNGDATNPTSAEPGLFGSFIYVFADGSAGDICKVAVPAREHYAFDGYYTAQEGGVQIYDEGGELVPENVPGNVTDDITLYAHWIPIKYQVTFHLGDGVKGNFANAEIAYKSGYEVKDDYSRDFTKAGYSFKGWSRTDGSSNVQYPCGSNFSVTGDMDLYAVWVANRYSIEYYDSGVLCGSDDAVYDATMNLTSVEDLGIRKTGHAFAGWSLEDGGKPAYEDGAEVKNLSAEAGGTVKLHAAWKANGYGISYELNGGEMKDDGYARVYSYGTGTLLPTAVEKKGCIFLGWQDASGNIVTAVGPEEMGDRHYTAVWDRASFSVKIDADGGKINDAGYEEITSYKYDTGRISLPSDVTKEGYVFAGWHDVGLGERITEIDTTICNNRNIYAKWVADGAEPSPSPGGAVNPSQPPDGTAKPSPAPSGTAKPSPGKTAKPSETPGKPIAKTATAGKVVYRVSGKKAAVKKASSKKVAKVTVKDSVKIGGKTYKVASIDANAFKNCKKLKAVTVNAKNLSVIGKNAFRGCGKLRSVKIKSKKISKAGKGAFKGISKKAIINVPKNRVAKYRKMFRKAGLPGVKF